MRRLFAHIGLALTSLVLVGTTYNKVATNVDSNIEFKNGEQLVFRISPKTNNVGEVEPGNELTETTIKDIASEFESRLNQSNVSRYKVVTEGEDTVKVILARESQNEYEKIKTFLSFNGSFALTTSKDTVALGSEFLTDTKAYLDNINGYPAVVIPFDNDSAAYKAVYEEALKQKEDGDGESVQTSEDETTVTTYMYLWYDYIEGYDTYSKTVSSNVDYDEAVASKIMMKFNVEDPYLPKSDENAADKLYSTINLDSNNDSKVTPDEIKAAYNTGRYFVNLLNASELSAHVEFIYQASANMWVDEILAMNTHLSVAFSNTFRAILIGVAIVALLLAIFYRLGAVSIATISICSTYLGMCVLSWLGVEFSIAALIGVITVAVASLASGVVYANKLKEECYRGRGLKKANSEASRRSLLPIVDIHVVLVLVGAFAYVLGGPLMKSFAAVTVLGGLMSLVLNTIGLNIMMWLATNATALNGKYIAFGVAKEQVPDLMNEEKQSYYGAYADKDFTKSRKPMGIAAIALSVIAIGGMILSGVLTNGSVYRQASTVAPTELFLEMETTADDNNILEAEVRDNLLTVADATTVDGKKLSSYITEINLYNRTDVVSTKDGAETFYYSYYVVSFNKNFKGSESAVYELGGTKIEDKIGAIFSETHSEEINFTSDVTVSLKASAVVSKDQPAFLPLLASTLVGIAVSGLYLMLRYRLSRGIASLLITLGAAALTAGLFAVIPLGVGSYVVIAAPVVAFIVMVFEILVMNKERELIIEDKSRDNSIEKREEIMVNATRLSCTPIIIFGILITYIALNFFGFGPAGTAYLFMNILFGILVSGALVVTVFGPLAQVFYKLLSKIQIDRPAKKTKKAKVVHKSAEPEEAIFIGIND